MKANRLLKLITSLVSAATLGLVILFAGCKTQPTPTTTPAVYSLPELKYKILSAFPDYFWCDPDFWPIVREGQEQKNAIDQFFTIKSDQSEFSAILTHLNLPDKSDYTDAEKLLIYREHKTLNGALQVTPASAGYNFIIRIKEGQGERIEGTITTAGLMKQTKREPSINTCPICLSKGTLIDTPEGQIPVEKLTEGMMVWSVDCCGNRISIKIAEIASTPVSADFEFTKIRLSDGRSVTASPGHPAAQGKTLSGYQVGDTLDGATVIDIEYITIGDTATYDILPSGTTGEYWANGILLKSTLR